MALDFAQARAFIGDLWEREVIGVLSSYIRIPNKSPAFDPDWERHGHMDKAVALFANWARSKLSALDGATIEVVKLPARTPVIYIEIPGNAPGSVLMYGHLDKQPEMTGWAEGTSAWEPVLKNGRLYGRGGADDGYALFASLSALLALKQQGQPFARTAILIEGSEESGSQDLPAYVDHLADRIGSPDLVICLDSGAGNYEQLWLTTSLRGLVVGTLSVRVLTEGVHSGGASGIVPSGFRILRDLLSRIEDPSTGVMKLPELFVEIPQERLSQAEAAAEILGDEVFNELPFFESTKPMASDNVTRILEKTWKPQLAVTAVDGYPGSENGGNVLLPYSAVKISLRVPPTCNAEAARIAVKRVLETASPYDATVSFEGPRAGNGWNAPSLAPWLAASLDKASNAAFGKPVGYQGEGGSIPFMGMLGARFPETQFVVVGVLGPRSNAHGPNEFLHLRFAKRLSACVAQVLADHALRGGEKSDAFA
jgi:acetylornithine deacetylase/succinyl-diaminopimelate desuccinylase-like protein